MDLTFPPPVCVSTVPVLVHAGLSIAAPPTLELGKVLRGTVVAVLHHRAGWETRDVIIHMTSSSVTKFQITFQVFVCISVFKLKIIT